MLKKVNLQMMNCRRVLGMSLCRRRKSRGLPTHWWMLIVNLKRVRIRNRDEDKDKDEDKDEGKNQGTERHVAWKRTKTRRRRNRRIRQGEWKEVGQEWTRGRTLTRRRMRKTGAEVGAARTRLWKPAAGVRGILTRPKPPNKCSNDAQ